MPIIETPEFDVIANSDTTSLWNPSPLVLPTAALTEAVFGVYLAGVGTSSKIEIGPGIQYSDDGVTFDTAVAVGLVAGPPIIYRTSTAGWSFSDTAQTLPPSPATERRFARLGVFTENTGVGDVNYQGGRARVRIDVPAMAYAQSLTYPLRRVFAYDASYQFFDVTGWMRAEDAARVRVALEVYGSTGGVDLAVGYQECNKPDVTSDITAATYFTTPKVGGDGIVYSTVWEALPQTRGHVRIGIGAKTSAGATKAALAALRLDLRGI